MSLFFNSFGLVDVLGYVAATFTTGSYVLQVIQIWRTRQVRDISLGMYVAVVVGVLLWLLFGLATGSRPIVIANAITLALSGLVLVAKLRFHTLAGVAHE